MNTERSWLIRTTQNQILGPVAKAKVLEFLQKGALGLSDEVCSGNGFWFSLKEKDLVEKFLYGDIPQGYNPISESKSVLSKRDNPDKTTSLNTAPANKTQVLKSAHEGPGIIPKSEDLEYPDITLINAAPVTTSVSAPTAGSELLDAKIPNQEDLEFPDITMVARPATPSHGGHDGMQTHSEPGRPIEMKSRPAEKVEAPVDEGPVVYPKDDDLAFPDFDNHDNDVDFQVHIPEKTEVTPAPKKSSKAEIANTTNEDSNLTLVFNTNSTNAPKAEAKPEKLEGLSLAKKTSAHAPAPQQHHQPEKLLHERKVKASAQPHPKEPTKDLPAEVQERVMPEHLKKRNDNYLLYILVIIVLIILGLFFYYYRNILNKPLPV
jgi:hypothetical protein